MTRTPFDRESLAAAVSEALTEHAPEATNAFSLVAMTTGVKAVVSVKVNDHWQIRSAVGIDYDGRFDGVVAVMATW